MAKSQLEKQFVQLAGEFGVVSELCRREIQASLTYGNSKSADVFVIAKDGSRAAKLEVKSSTRDSWIVGKQAENVAPHIVWVFVYFPAVPKTFSPAQVAENGAGAPQFHVLTSAEVKKIYEGKLEEAKVAADKKRGRKNSDVVDATPDPAVVDADATAETQLPPIITFNKSDLQSHYGAWKKVPNALAASK